VAENDHAVVPVLYIDRDAQRARDPSLEARHGSSMPHGKHNRQRARRPARRRATTYVWELLEALREYP
jgi:hypothetical protein